MKKRTLLCCILCAASAAYAHNGAAQKDSLQNKNLQEVEILAGRATETTPVAYTNIGKEVLKKSNTGVDFPYLISSTPSALTTSDAGAGIGYTTLRVRGTDGTRINVTANGIPINDAESHNVFWVNMPDLASSVKDVQIQRGVGTSTNGAGAFGASINMQISEAGNTPYAEFSGSAGSFGTHKATLKVGSGLIADRWAIDLRLSDIGSDGYIDRAETSLQSYYLQGSYFTDNTAVKLITFAGEEQTYHAWNYATKEEMALYGRRYHTEGQYETSHGPYVLADGTHVDYYDDQTDNYLQINNQLVLNHRFNDRWMLSATGFYTYGYGYYKQYKDARTLFEYGNLGVEDYSLEADMIRRKIMRNHTVGVNGSVGYTANNLSLLMGGSYSYYTCPHWGDLEWVDGWEKSQIGGRWYDNDVDKQDANLFVKASWQPAKGLNLFADLQYRYVHYKAWGVNDNFDWNTMQMQPIDIDKVYNFFNPRVGVNYTFAKRHNIFASFAIAQKEPTRADFTDRYMFAADQTQPTSERLYDYELGYNYLSDRLSLGVNLYYMRYKDQLIPTGMVNDSSDALNVNVPDSYRYGVELTAAWDVARVLTVGGSATLSRNKILDYVDLLADSPTYGENLGTMTIAYSPDVVASAYLDFHVGGFEAVWRTQWVGSQYFTNNEIEALSLDSYSVTNLDLAYTLRTRSAKSVRLGMTIYNLLNATYCSNGYGYSYMWDGVRYDEAYYFPQAPMHVLANVTVKF